MSPDTERRDRKPSWSSRLKRTGVEPAVFIATVLFVLAMITVPLPGDPLNYLDAAQHLSNAELHHGTTRIGVTLPVWLLTLVFGYSEVSLYTVPIVGAAALGLATAMLGRTLFNTWVGVGAALLVVTSPWFLPYATQLLPDIGSAALVTLSLAWVVRASERDGGSREAWLAGLAFGYAYLVKETSLLFMPPLLGSLIILGLTWSAARRVLLGSIIVAVVEGVVGVILWGDPLARINSLLLRSGTAPSPERIAANEAAFAAQSDPISSFSIMIELLWSNPHGRVIAVLGLALLTATLVWRSRRLITLVVWILVPWLMLALLGSFHPESGRPVIRLMLDRYWIGFLPLFAIGGLGAVALGVRRFRGDLTCRIVAWMTASIVAATAGIGVVTSVDSRSDWFIRFGNDAYWQLRESLASVEGSPVMYIDSQPAKLIRLYAHDPLGRRVFPGRLSSDPSVLEGSSSWQLVDLQYSSSVEDDVLSPESRYRVYNVDDKGRWVILTEQAIDPRAETAQLGLIDRDGWRQRLVVDGNWSTPAPHEPTVAIGDDEMLVVFDDRGPYSSAPLDDDFRVRSESITSIRLDTDHDGGGVRAVCEFHPSGNPSKSTRVQAATVGTDGEQGGLLVLCAPPEGRDVYDFRLLVIFTGPGEIGVGTAEVSSLSPSEVGS